MYKIIIKELFYNTHTHTHIYIYVLIYMYVTYTLLFYTQYIYQIYN